MVSREAMVSKNVKEVLRKFIESVESKGNDELVSSKYPKSIKQCLGRIRELSYKFQGRVREVSRKY